MPQPPPSAASQRPGRLAQFGATIFGEMSALAGATGSINLGQGFPDTDGPSWILAEASRAILDGRGNQYPPALGIPELRQAIADHQQSYYGLRFDPGSEVLVTVGATEAIAAAILGLTEPGDEVVVFEPYYDSYAACVALAGATRRAVTLRPEAGRWSFDPAELEAAITPRTRVVLLNSPHNPTGTVFSRGELEAIARLARERDLLVVSDEVYEHLVFDGEHIPIASLPGMAERTVTISSAGKTFSVTGWKVGWACARPGLLEKVRSVKQFLTYVGSGPFQHAIAAALRSEPNYYREFAANLQGKRDLLTEGLLKQGFSTLVPQATYFATIDLGPGGRGQEWCRALPHQAGVVAIPARVFYDSDVDRYVRFAFCKQDEVLREALRRLERLG
ncbi:MAG: aminotransferase [Frankiales bacterium]|nr:aminotransferase [Frankiales bacterium]